MAADLQEITLRARDLLPAMKERLSAVKAQAAQNGKALTGKSNVKVASESTIKIKNPDGTVNAVREQAANPGANRQLFHDSGKLTDQPIPGIDKPSSSGKRNRSFLTADGDVLSPYLTIERILKEYGEDAGRELLMKFPILQIVKGRPVCLDCLVDLPKLAAHYDIPAILLFDEYNKRFLFWRKGMPFQLVPLGRDAVKLDIAGLATKVLALGGSRVDENYEEDR